MSPILIAVPAVGMSVDAVIVSIDMPGVADAARAGASILLGRPSA